VDFFSEFLKFVQNFLQCVAVCCRKFIKTGYESEIVENFSIYYVNVPQQSFYMVWGGYDQ